jgi:cbb3-type cytochrome c oxidase subunit III
MRRSKSSPALFAAFAASILFAQGAPAASGQALYKGCAVCHGQKGGGNAALKSPAIAGLETWYVTRQLKNFATGARGAAAGDTEGATMRAAAALLKDDAERKAVAGYIATMKPARIASREPANAARATNGRNYFNALCSACHGSNGKGNEQLGAPRLAGAAPDYLMRQFAAFKAGRRGSHPDDKLGAQMRAIAAMLPNSDTEQDVIAYATGLPP